MTTPSLKGTQTEKNLLADFAGESQARNRYTYYAGQAKKDGYMHISAIFEETANQEKEHAKRFFKFLEGGKAEIIGIYPAGVIGTTEANLLEAAEGEYEEWHDLYPKHAEIAKAEGFDEIAKVYNAICIAEKQHEKRYRAFLKSLEDGTVFKRQGVTWRCRNCGYICGGETAPDLCPACAHPQAHFEILAENW